MSIHIFKYNSEQFADVTYVDEKFLYKGKRPLIEVNNVSGLELSDENGIVYEDPMIFSKLDAFRDPNNEYQYSVTRGGPKIDKLTAFFNADGVKLDRSAVDITEEFTCSLLVEPKRVIQYEDAAYLLVTVHQIRINDVRELPKGCVLYDSLSDFL